MNSLRNATLVTLLLCFTTAHAETGGLYVKPTFGMSNLSNSSGVRTGQVDQVIEVNTSLGFTAGISLGYRYNHNLSAELGWEYRSNDSETIYSDGTLFPNGNFASNLFYVNGIWHFDARRKWHPYVGAGLGFIQEIDIDLEAGGIEQSFSDSGNFGSQVFGGIDYGLTEHLKVGVEIRYSNVSKVDLPAEENATGNINGLEYDPLTIGLTMTYQL
ncbi:MAG: outer membrane beta-barrel protein [Porticoccaceae bacterium]